MSRAVKPSSELPPEPGELRRTELILRVQDRPGTLADIGELLGEADVNILTAAVFTVQGEGHIHLVVEDADAAIAALKRVGFQISEVRDVMAVTLEDRPGELGRYARKLSDGGINISSLYIAGERAGEKELIVAIEKVQ